MFPILYTIYTAALIYAASCLASLYQNARRARGSGLQYIIVPFYLPHIPWVLLQPILLPLLDRFPKSWTTPWLAFLSMDRCWSYGHQAFAEAGTDTIITVSAWGNILHTCDPGLNVQLFKANDFEKPARLLAPLNLYGPTMTATERQESRLYRKLTASFFNEASMRMVWDVCSFDIKVLGKILASKRSAAMHKGLRPLLAKMSLHIVSQVCFGVHYDIRRELESRLEPPSGHKLTFSDAFHTVLPNLRELFALPKLLLGICFSKALRADSELNQYLDELIQSKRETLASSQQSSGADILDVLVSAGSGKSPKLSTPAIKGNIWLFMFAGHEANANTLTFLILLLATHPKLQRMLQADIDQLDSSGSYTDCYEYAMKALPGAVIQEALRLYTVIPFILKATWDEPKAVNLQGQLHSIPPQTLIMMHTNGTHRNPQLWSEPERQDSGAAGMPFPLAAFNPWQWLRQSSTDTEESVTSVPGSFFPFSEGTRGCLGKKFALVELCASVVHLFGQYSVELIVDGLNTSDDTAVRGSKADRQHMWQEVRDHADYEMSSGVEFDMSLRLTGEVPIRFVSRGMESLVDIEEEG